MMGPAEQTIVFALLAVLFFAIALFADDERWWLSIGCTGVLVSYWALNTVMWMMSAVEDWSLPSDILFAGGALALALWVRTPWLMALTGLFALNLLLDGLHVAGWIGYQTWAEAGNVTFVCQLGAASFPGLVRITRSLVGAMPASPAR